MSKIGEDFWRQSAALGFQELRNAVSFEPTNVADDIRGAAIDPRQELQSPVSPTPMATSPAPELEQQQER